VLLLQGNFPILIVIGKKKKEEKKIWVVISPTRENRPI
jgi:hypothetical protein